MAIDLSGKGSSHKEKKESKDKIELYVPEEEKVQKPKKQKKKKPEKPQKVMGNESLDLAGKEKRKRKIISWILRGLVIFIIGAGVLAGGYFAYVAWSNRPARPTVTQPTTPPPQQPEVTPEPITPEPEQEPTQPAGALPDTELAPLSGAIVTFRGEDELYLVESNGELRVITTSVVFENGDLISDVSGSLIYVINDSWKGIRQGRSVEGQVDFDPRVLTLPEIRPFL